MEGAVPPVPGSHTTQLPLLFLVELDWTNLSTTLRSGVGVWGGGGGSCNDLQGCPGRSLHDNLSGQARLKA